MILGFDEPVNCSVVFNSQRKFCKLSLQQEMIMVFQ